MRYLKNECVFLTWKLNIMKDFKFYLCSHWIFPPFFKLFPNCQCLHLAHLSSKAHITLSHGHPRCNMWGWEMECLAFWLYSKGTKGKGSLGMDFRYLGRQCFSVSSTSTPPVSPPTIASHRAYTPEMPNYLKFPEHPTFFRTPSLAHVHYLDSLLFVTDSSLIIQLGCHFSVKYPQHTHRHTSQGSRPGLHTIHQLQF